VFLCVCVFEAWQVCIRLQELDLMQELDNDTCLEMSKDPVCHRRPLNLRLEERSIDE
jgi:hypothetical protein